MVTYISEFPYKPNVNSLKNGLLYIVRGQKYYVKNAGKDRKREATLGKDNSLPLLPTLGTKFNCNQMVLELKTPHRKQISPSCHFFSLIAFSSFFSEHSIFYHYFSNYYIFLPYWTLCIRIMTQYIQTFQSYDFMLSIFISLSLQEIDKHQPTL